MPKTGFLARWNVQVRSNPQLAALQSPGLARSYPLLAAEDGRLQTCHFYHVADQVGPNQLHLGPPLGCVVMDHADGSLLAAYPGRSVWARGVFSSRFQAFGGLFGFSRHLEGQGNHRMVRKLVQRSGM